MNGKRIKNNEEVERKEGGREGGKGQMDSVQHVIPVHHQELVVVLL